MRTLVAVPVYNEEKYVEPVLAKISRFAGDVLVVDDGSTDETPCLLAKLPVDVIRHRANRGYGRSLIDAFRWARCYGYEWVITMDCDEQHEPESLPDFYSAIASGEADIYSGSRYLRSTDGGPDGSPPADRRAINAQITHLVNATLDLGITDAFCGFKAYRASAINELSLDETGYAFPLQFWVQVAAHGLRVEEVPIRLIYNDPNRSFGGPLDDAERRLQHYLAVWENELAKFPHLAEKSPQPLTACACESRGGCA